MCLFELPSYLVDRPSEVTRATSGRRAAVREDFPFPRGRLRPRASNDQFFFTGRVCEMSEASGGATAMDTLERKFAIPEKSGDAGEADSPEQSGVQTPKHEYQSGFKRLRPKGWEEVEGSEHGTGSGEDDELPGTSAGSIEATPDEVRYLQNRTKSACSQLADSRCEDLNLVGCHARGEFQNLNILCSHSIYINRVFFKSNFFLIKFIVII